MADPAVLTTAIGTAVTGGLLSVARIIEAVSNYLDARNDSGGGKSSRRGKDLRRARKLEKQAQDLRSRYRTDDDGDGPTVLPFEQAWVTG